MEARSSSVVTRRTLLALAADSALAAGLLPAATALASAPRAVGSWPRARLTSADARRINRSQFMPASQLLQWHRELDALGLRATGSPAQDRFIDALHERLAAVGVHGLHFEPVPHRRWLAERFSLRVGPEGDLKPVATASYIPYSGGTPTGGVTGPLVSVDPETPLAAGSLRGKIALFSLPLTALTYATFGALAYDTYDPAHILQPSGVYARAWLSIPTLISMLDALVRAQAAACICALDLPADASHGAYYPYDGVIRPVPGVFVDSPTGERLRRAAASGGHARVELRSQTRQVITRNLVGTIPGASDELVLLHSHTDGPNGIEDNGPNAIVAIAQYLTRLPARALPRTVMLLLTTGHFAGGIGVETFVARHRGGSLRRTAAALTLEHLGALEWNPGPGGRSRLTGHGEPGTIFTPESSAMVSASDAALRRANDDPSSVLRPYLPAPGSPDGNGWPAEGTQLWTQGALPTANYITGPTYLLNWGIPTLDKLDVARMRDEAISFAEMLIALSRVPRGKLRTLDLLRPR